MPPDAPARAPVFILGRDRSGTTLLRYILDAHPSLCCPPELNLGPICRDLYQVATRTVGYLQTHASEEERQRFLWSEVRRTLEVLLGAYASGKGKQVWCDKSTNNLIWIDTLTSVYPDARFIGLHRHCLDVVHSAVEANRYEWTCMDYPWVREARNFTEAIALHWVNETEKQLAFEQAHPDTCFHVTYESLLAEPERTLTSLFAFLGVSIEEGFVDKIFTRQHDVGAGDWKILFTHRLERDNMGKGAQVPLRLFSPATLARMNTLLQRLGYAPVEPGAPGPKAQAAEPPPKAQVSMASVDDVFEQHIPSRLRENARALVRRAVYRFVVLENDATVGTWRVDLKEGGRISRGDGEADCTIVVGAQALLDIAHGKVNAFDAFQEGKIKVSGDMEAALLLGQVL